MNNIDERATAILLASLDREIELKCTELKEKQAEAKLKKLFFTSCIVIMLLFFLQAVFQIFNVNYIFILLIYQAMAAVLIVPVILSIAKGRVLR